MIGVGMALAILVDATMVRALLVPATMRLLGRWNWWAPAPLGPSYERYSLREGRRARRRRRTTIRDRGPAAAPAYGTMVG